MQVVREEVIAPASLAEKVVEQVIEDVKAEVVEEAEAEAVAAVEEVRE